jgi:hypothetical protein
MPYTLYNLKYALATGTKKIITGSKGRPGLGNTII